MASSTPISLTGAAGRYAQALYAYAEDTGHLPAVITNLARFAALIDAAPDLARALASPLIPAAQSRAALTDIIRAQHLGDVAHRLVGVLLANRRLALLRPVLGAFAVLVAEKRGIVTADVTTAHAMTEVQEQSLRARLIELGYGNVHIERHIDPTLLGGLVLRIGARLFDSSLKSRLNRLQFAMKGAA